MGKGVFVGMFFLMVIFGGFLYFTIFLDNEIENFEPTLEEECDWRYGDMEIINFDTELKKKMKLDEDSKRVCCYKEPSVEDNLSKSCYWTDEERRYILGYILENDIWIYSGNMVMPKTTKILGKKSLDKITSFSPDTGVITFSEITPEIKFISEGDGIIIGVTEHTPYGALVKVIEIQDNEIIFS